MIYAEQVTDAGFTSVALASVCLERASEGTVFSTGTFLLGIVQGTFPASWTSLGPDLKRKLFWGETTSKTSLYVKDKS